MKGIHYKLLEPIHELFQGEVFKAEWSGVEGFVKFVSVCKVRPELSRDSRSVELLLEDLRKISKKPVGAVTRVLDAWTDTEGVAACTEYEAGVTLWELMEKASSAGVSLPVESLLSIVLDVARALETLHEPHVMVGEIFHGDLRPEHILLSHSGAVKLQGLGYGRFLTAANPAGDWFLWRGRCYQPRERQRGGAPDARSDVFSLGGVL